MVIRTGRNEGSRRRRERAGGVERKRLEVRTEAPAWTAFVDRRRSDPAGLAEATLPTAELADCDCPEFCERDHENE